MELFILFWLACAFGAAIVAGAKGRSSVGWFLLGLPFGILALLVSIGMPSLNAVAMDPQAVAYRRRNKRHQLLFLIVIIALLWLMKGETPVRTTLMP